MVRNSPRTNLRGGTNFKKDALKSNDMPRHEKTEEKRLEKRQEKTVELATRYDHKIEEPKWQTFW